MTIPDKTYNCMNMIKTPRLLLRPWRQEDAQQYYQINQDPKVIEYLLGPMTIEQVDKFIIDMNQRLDAFNYTLWAVEEKCSGELIGFCGLQDASQIENNEVEIGWRLGSQYWGKGYATEAAKAVLQYAFSELKLKSIISFTAVGNLRSRRVMEKLGMQYKKDFIHPKLAEDHPLALHALYSSHFKNWRR